MAPAAKMKLPIVFAVSHAIVTVLVFAFAIVDPVRSGLLPVIVFALDFPVSLLIIQIHEPFLDWSTRSVLFFDGLSFLIVGTLWFYLLGFLLSKGIRRLAAR